MVDATNNSLLRQVEVRREAEALVGERAWFLLTCYGKFIEGAYAGSYVGSVPFAVQLDIVYRLVRGESVPVHLMHRHRSGNCEASSLRLAQDNALVMVFPEREETA